MNKDTGLIGKYSNWQKFWIYFWLSLGWKQRAQWIIIQHLNRVFVHGEETETSE